MMFDIFKSMKNLSAILSGTGGISYHYMAWKYHSNLWRRYLENLNVLLCDWKHFCPELVLVGPSAGYSLSTDFLLKFEKIHVYDPDPLARWIFQKRFPNVHVQWNVDSPFFHPGKDSLKGLWNVKTRHPEAAILFCNVLGQWPLLESINESRMQEFVDQLMQIYNHGNWASFHDVFSGPSRWRTWSHEKQRQSVDFHSTEDVKDFWLQLGRGALTDHLTFKKFKNAKKTKHLLWPLTPRQIHIIEWAQG